MINIKTYLKNISTKLVLSLCFFSFALHAQTISKTEKHTPLKIVSNHIYEEFIKNPKKAQEQAINDIKSNNTTLLLASGIAPVSISSDTDFEKKYNLSFYEYGCTPPEFKVILAYNNVMFDHMLKLYGTKWITEIREDIAGFKNWKENLQTTLKSDTTLKRDK
ncbi:hypothetical protein LY01_02466 [Nonlabens xylanidelens]|uniref:Uncharacterized protein n=1 Tax=Nonlabens xylanidelens TaxID=191564 RepID=A0A2S6IHJ4_9FLAO|nr:hypothetical protein [Nonlabens xylanidelens]PPK93683.1 hypothetical protein LY01_02466 [Nonlabens xylanidelens]PQJ17739.1 hypothetical protein BST94_11935 [Nonlabens xylanidelens]